MSDSELRVFPQEVLSITNLSEMELPIVAAKMFRMKLRPTLVDCLIALRDKEVDPQTIIEAIKADEVAKIENEVKDKNKDWSSRHNINRGNNKIRSSRE